MRDPELMVALLKEMSEGRGGRTAAPLMSGGLGVDRHHHMELLVDAGHAEWLTSERHIARITNDGYDFLNAVDKNAEAKAKFLGWFDKGVTYARAAMQAVEFVNKLSGNS